MQKSMQEVDVTVDAKVERCQEGLEGNGMTARGEGPGRSLASLYCSLGLLGALTGCTPTVNVAGVYFPGWLVSTAVGVVGAYGVVFGLSRRSQTRELADSGLLFLSLLAGIALSVWWVFFSGF
jgi:hypothetical protein